MATRHLAPIAQYREPYIPSATPIFASAYVAEVAPGDFVLTTDASDATHVIDNDAPGAMTLSPTGGAISPARLTYQGGTYLAYGVS